MMFLGVLVHATPADFDAGYFDSIRFASGTFRMACFFIISGFFSVMVLQKSPQISFLKKRMILLGVPAALCVLFLVPITKQWMETYFVEGRAPNEYMTGWMAHSWFLFVLMIYTALLPLMIWVAERSVQGLSRIMPAGAAQALLFLGVVIAAMIAQKALQKFGPQLPLYEYWRSLVTYTVIYLPHFLLGVSMFMWRDIYDKLHRWPVLWSMLAAAGVGLKYQLGHYEITSTLQHLGHMMIGYGTAIAVSAALFAWSARLLTKENPLVRLMSESAYTVYILHYFIIAWVLMELQRLGVAMPVRMVTAFLTASVLGVAFHVFVVRRSAIAAFLVNGKMTKAPWAKLQVAKP